MASKEALALCKTDKEALVLKQLLSKDIRNSVSLDEIESILEAIRSAATNLSAETTPLQLVDCLSLCCRHWQNDIHKLEQATKARIIYGALDSFLLRDVARIIEGYSERYELITFTSGMPLKLWSSERKQHNVAGLQDIYRIGTKYFFVINFQGYGYRNEFVSAQSQRIQPLYTIKDNTAWRLFYNAPLLYQHYETVDVWDDNLGNFWSRPSWLGTHYERFCAPPGTFTTNRPSRSL